MKILKLMASNVMRLVGVEIEPDGNLVVIGGKNGAGKTSVLDSICMAIGGKRLFPPEPLRRGAKSGEIVIDLGDLVVTRTFSSTGPGSLKVQDSEGAKLGSPQAVLDKLFGSLSFDPLDFSRQRPAEQSKTLRKLLGLNFSEPDKRKLIAFDERTDVNREVKRLAAQVEGMPHHDDAPVAEVASRDLLVELQKGRDQNDENYRKREEAGRAKRRVEEFEGRHESLKERLLELQADIKNSEADVAAVLGQLQKREDEANLCVDVDLAPIEERLSNLDEENRKVRENAGRSAAEGLLSVKKAQSVTLSNALADIQQEKDTMIAEAKFPVDGLGFDETGVTMNDLPFSQASTAEKLRVSVAMGIKMNPELRVMLIRDGSLLDESSLAMVAAMAEESDFSIWIERVEQDEHVTVLIEDGSEWVCERCGEKVQSCECMEEEHDAASED